MFTSLPDHSCVFIQNKTFAKVFHFPVCKCLLGKRWHQQICAHWLIYVSNTTVKQVNAEWIKNLRQGIKLHQIASNQHEVILKYLAFKDQLSQKWQLYPVLITVYYPGFFQHNSFCTGPWKSISYLIIQCLSKCVTLSSAGSTSWAPSHCHTYTSNFLVGAPTSATFCCLKLPHKSGVPSLCLSRSPLYWEHLSNRVLQKAFFSGAQPRHFSLMPYFSGLCTPCDLDLHFACLKIKKKRALICATPATKLQSQQKSCNRARTSRKGSIFHSSNWFSNSVYSLQACKSFFWPNQK